MRRVFNISVEDVFAVDGPLAKVYGEGYEPRQSQVQMAQSIHDHVKEGKHLVVEAPTGSGKSMAYLIGGLLTGRTVIVATANHGLQRQLMDIDLPVLRKVSEELGDTLDFALLMGKSNYFCKQRAASPDGTYANLDLLNWGVNTGPDEGQETGFAYEFEAKHRLLESGEWLNVCADDSCSRWQCPEAGSCGYMGAIRSIAGADVVVVNQHLLAIEVTNGMIGGIATPANFGGVAGSIVVVDEAHEWPDILASSNSIEMHIGRFRPYENEAWYSQVVSYFDLAYSQWIGKGVEEPNLQTVIEDEFPETLSQRLFEWATQVWPSSNIPASPGDFSLKSKAERARSLAMDLMTMAKPSNDGVVRLFERNNRTWARRHNSIYLDHVLFRLQVIDVSKIGRLYIHKCNEPGPDMPEGEGVPQRVNIFTSATIQSAASFQFFLDEAGMEGMDTMVLPPVFDYRANGILYTPKDLPDDIHSDEFLQAAGERCWQLAKITDGRMFVLITSYAKLKIVSDVIQECIVREADPVEWKVLRQDEDSSMVAQFKEREGHKVILLGTATYWQGVDVPGEALGQVVIVNLPFAPHVDPIFKAKANLIEKKYGPRSSFIRLSIPLMGRKLRQGGGRLHRRKSDRGAITIMDKRVVTSRWGALAISDLPLMRKTESIEHVEMFFGRAVRSEDLI